MKRGIRTSVLRFLFICLALATLISFFLTALVSLPINTVTIHDYAHVLDAAKVEAAGNKLSVPIVIFTTRSFHGDQHAFNQLTTQQLPDQGAIVLGIDSVHSRLSLAIGTEVQSINPQVSDVLREIGSHDIDGDDDDDTVATIAILDALQGDLSARSDIKPWQVRVAILLEIVVFGFIVVIIQRRRIQDFLWRIWNHGRESRFDE